MNTQPITINVDAETATAYRSSSEEERRKLDLLLALKLREAIRPGRSLLSVMEEIAKTARARGLTEAELQAILNGS